MDNRVIDMHSHYYGGLVEGLRRRTTRPYVSTDTEGRLVLNAMTASTVMSPGYTDASARIAYLDQAGIATQLMTFPGALGVDVMPIGEVAGLISDFNDDLAAVCRMSGGRLCGLAGLPLADMPAATREFRRIRLELGLPGVILPGDFFLSVERAEELRPIFRAADELGGLLLVHPGLAVGGTPPEPYPDTSILRTSVLTLQASIAQMGMTLLFGSLLDDHLNVAVQLVNLGGTLPFIVERLEAVSRSRPLERSFDRERLRLLHYDCASLGPRALEMAVKMIGADRILFGTDYPIFQPSDPAQTIDDAELGSDEKAMIRSLNGTALLKRFGWSGNRVALAAPSSEMKSQ